MAISDTKSVPDITDGIVEPLPASFDEYTALGAITDVRDTIYINGTTLAMTLADPAVSQEGLSMKIQSKTASAHTVTNTTGFNNGSTASDVATFGGAIGDSFTISVMVVAGTPFWAVDNLNNVTLG